MSVILRIVNLESLGNAEILRELGRRLRRERLDRNVTQSDLAEAAGISRRTLVKLEQGEVTTLETLLGVLRGLKLLNRLDVLLPERPLSPVQLARFEGSQRQRARAPSEGKSQPKPWTWAE